MQFHPTSTDLNEASRVFTAMDAMNLGAECFAKGLMEVSPEFAQAVAEQLERMLALKNHVDTYPPHSKAIAGAIERYMAYEKTLAKSMG